MHYPLPCPVLPCPECTLAQPAPLTHHAYPQLPHWAASAPFCPCTSGTVACRPVKPPDAVAARDLLALQHCSPHISQFKSRMCCRSMQIARCPQSPLAASGAPPLSGLAAARLRARAHAPRRHPVLILIRCRPAALLLGGAALLARALGRRRLHRLLQGGGPVHRSWHACDCTSLRLCCPPALLPRRPSRRPSPTCASCLTSRGSAFSAASSRRAASAAAAASVAGSSLTSGLTSSSPSSSAPAGRGMGGSAGAAGTRGQPGGRMPAAVSICAGRGGSFASNTGGVRAGPGELPCRARPPARPIWLYLHDHHRALVACSWSGGRDTVGAGCLLQHGCTPHAVLHNPPSPHAARSLIRYALS